MGEMVRFTLRDRGSVVVEVDEEGPATGPAGRGSDAVRDAREAFGRRLTDVRDAAIEALDTFRTAASPDEIKLSFGVKLTSEAGAIIARTAVEGNLAVELLWRSDPSS